MKGAATRAKIRRPQLGTSEATIRRALRRYRMNRLLKIFVAAAVVVGGLAGSATASAHWHGTVGVWIGPGPYGWGPPYYPYYYPPVIVADPVYAQPNPVVQV